jgi:hypothetical protein
MNRFRILVAVLLVTLLIPVESPTQQACEICAAGCKEETGMLVYDPVNPCNCPIGSSCTSSGGICTDCFYGGLAWCYGDWNGCITRYSTTYDQDCGCGDIAD